MKIKEYSAVIEGKDSIRVVAVKLADAVRQIARHCEAGELFTIGNSTYRVNGFLANQPATRLRRGC